jgi:hypothetical protein
MHQAPNLSHITLILFRLFPSPPPPLFLLSWVSHQVMPTPGAARRVAVGFNIPGEWEGTADVGTTYALPKMTNVPSFDRMYQKHGSRRSSNTP